MITGGVIPRYTYLNQIYVSLKLRLLKKEGGSNDWVPVEDADNAAPSMMLLGKVGCIFQNKYIVTKVVIG